MIHKAWNGLEEVPSCFQGHLSIFKVTQEKKSLILTPFECFRTVALVWVHRWLWNDAQSLKQPRAGVLLFFKDICQILKLCGLEIADLDPILGRSQLSNPSGLPFLFRLQVSFNMDKIVCAVCFDRIRDCFLMPCGHTLCRPYATQIQETSRSCPHCRAIFTEIKELFPWIDFDLIHDIGRFVIFFEYLPGKVLVAPPWNLQLPALQWVWEVSFRIMYSPSWNIMDVIQNVLLKTTRVIALRTSDERHWYVL